MRWTPAIAELRDLLAEFYRTAEQAMPVITDAGLNTSRISLSGSAVSLWQSILEEALKQDTIAAIIARAKKDFPTNSALNQVAQAIHNASTQTTTVTPRSASVSPNDLRKFIAAHFGFADIDNVLANLTTELNDAGKQENGLPVTLSRDTLGGQTVGQVALSLIQYLQRRGWFDYLPPLARDGHEDVYDAQFGV